MAAPFYSPPSRGGHATPVRVKAPKPRRVRPPAPKPIMPEQAAMQTFRTALAQLRSSVAPVDAAAISAPYQAASVATGQLGQGLAQALLSTGQAAQQQYNQGLGIAQSQAAQFGASVGANGAPPVQNTGTGYLANQTQAQAAAAPMAATAWQQLLERTRAAKVADAVTQRQGVIDQGRASLAASLPSLIGQEKDRAFQLKTAAENNALARTQLTAKQQADYLDYQLGAAKAQQSARSSAARTAETRRHNQVTEAQGAAKVKLAARTSTAKAKGLKGIDAVTKALTAQPKSSKTTVPAGWDVQVQVIDQDTGEPTGETRKLRLPDKRRIPKGFKFISAQPATRTKSVTTGGEALTAKQWDTYFRSLRAQNPGRDAEIKAYLGPRPKK